MNPPRWIERRDLLILHAESLAEHGGAEGLRDEGLLESALARPQNLFADGGPDIFLMAAAYAFGIAKNHPFLYGNKRAAFLAAGVFLELNGWSLEADPDIATAAMLDLAAGELDEDGFAAWLRESCVAVDA
ncbi:MAG: type II toxin-antitoxin system death-on-curing family toxin [Caulobacterales bacterium]|jgi:death-on-curing protein